MNLTFTTTDQCCGSEPKRESAVDILFLEKRLLPFLEDVWMPIQMGRIYQDQKEMDD